MDILEKRHMCVFSARLRDWHWFALPMQVVFSSNFYNILPTCSIIMRSDDNKCAPRKTLGPLFPRWVFLQQKYDFGGSIYYVFLFSFFFFQITFCSTIHVLLHNIIAFVKHVVDRTLIKRNAILFQFIRNICFLFI